MTYGRSGLSAADTSPAANALATRQAAGWERFGAFVARISSLKENGGGQPPLIAGLIREPVSIPAAGSAPLRA